MLLIDGGPDGNMKVKKCTFNPNVNIYSNEYILLPLRSGVQCNNQLAVK